jgi:N-acetylgalactosamine-N,N'-diacetylbacillosaminyl-diphospho-undecaprenol 4-alpha-N-acetylgalactosaminyltransferase
MNTTKGTMDTKVSMVVNVAEKTAPQISPAPERIRVLFVLGSVAGGGAERIVTHLVKHLNRGEFDARVGLLWRHGDYLKEFTDSELVVARLAQGWIPYRDQPRWWQFLPSLALVPLQQREIVRRFRPDIVVTATKSMNIAARFSLPFARRSEFTWVAREGNNTGAMIDHESAGLLRALQNLAIRTAYRRADRVVAISNGVGEALSRRFHLDPERVSTIYNAVDLTAVRTRTEERPPDLPAQPFIVSAGRLVHQKGFDLLIRAFAQGISDRDVSLVILGEGPDRSALEELARTHGVQQRVFFPGFVDNPWGYFARAAAFVCPSRWEGFGNVIIEAMACGVPVVATDCDFGPREIVRHGDSGLLVAVENVPAIGAALASILDDRGLSARLADGARRRAADFDVPQMTRTYEQLFRELTLQL